MEDFFFFADSCFNIVKDSLMAAEVIENGPENKVEDKEKQNVSDYFSEHFLEEIPFQEPVVGNGKVKVAMETEAEGDKDSLVPGTGSINGDVTEDGVEDASEAGEDITEEEEEEENMSNVVQGTTETILNKLEENLAQVPDIDESELLQVAEPGPLDPEGRDIEQVLSIIR